MDSLQKEDDPTSETRKADHIALAFRSQVSKEQTDNRFYYEPMLAAHPEAVIKPFGFLGKKMHYPIWVSSMTGGTEKARKINKNLAIICGEFGFGMGLGSCRSILFEDKRLEDFSVRNEIGEEFPLYANLGIAQIESLCVNRQTDKIHDLLHKTKADGLIIHVNPMQEWLQPEGDRFKRPPVETIEEILAWGGGKVRVVVKEVGQGFGEASMRALLQMPLEALDFAASGGTNFALLELLRAEAFDLQMYKPFTQIGHTAFEMTDICNRLVTEMGEIVKCKQIIVSGGIADCLDGYYCTEKLLLPAVFGMASAFLRHAEDLEQLRKFAKALTDSYRTAKAFLRVR